MRGIKVLLFGLGALALLAIAVILLIFVIALCPFIVACLTLMRRNLARLWSDFKRGVFAWIVLSNYPLHRFFKFLRDHKRVEVTYVKRFPWNQGKLLIVSNHPSWLDQMALTQSMLSYLAGSEHVNTLPYIGTAKDSIVRLPFLKFLESFYILTPVERKQKREAGPLIERMEDILKNGGNLIISGPAGRDFRMRQDEEIRSPLKQKSIRRFGGLCGRLAAIEELAVTTIPAYIEGTERLFVQTNGKKEMKFSVHNFFVPFLLLDRFQIKIVFGEPLLLQGWPKEKARKEIEEAVLHLADLC